MEDTHDMSTYNYDDSDESENKNYQESSDHLELATSSLISDTTQLMKGFSPDSIEDDINELKEMKSDIAELKQLNLIWQT